MWSPEASGRHREIKVGKAKRYEVGLQSQGPNGMSLNRKRQAVLFPGNYNCVSKKALNQETVRWGAASRAGDL